MNGEKEHIVIRGCGAISPLGSDAASTAQAYKMLHPAFSTVLHQAQPTPVAALTHQAEEALQELAQSDRHYRQLDRSVLMAIHAGQQAAAQAGWLAANEEQEDGGLAVNIGSSRGATALFEQHYDAFKKSSLSSSSSPTTTLGNLSSWVAQAVNAGGAHISHSVTCSTALMAVANSMAWLKAGMAKRFLAGGTEAPLTDFTIAQMKAVGIYSDLYDHPYPCQPYAGGGTNTFVLGEGAAVFALESIAAHQLQKGDVVVEAIGTGSERIQSKTGISKEGLNFQKAMRQALYQLSDQDNVVDALITHTPGTQAGDKAELTAVQAVFPRNQPVLTNNKWLIGHTLGASGAFSMQYALHLLEQQQVPFLPYLECTPAAPLACSIKRLMVNAAGFGGNACSVILRLVD